MEPYAAQTFAEPDRFIGHDIKLASEVQTLRECRTIWREVMGRRPRHVPMSVWAFERLVGTDLITMWRWLQGGHFDVDTSQTHAILPTATTVRQWLIRHRHSTMDQ